MSSSSKSFHQYQPLITLISGINYNFSLCNWGSLDRQDLQFCPLNSIFRNLFATLGMVTYNNRFVKTSTNQVLQFLGIRISHLIKVRFNFYVEFLVTDITVQQCITEAVFWISTRLTFSILVNKVRSPQFYPDYQDVRVSNFGEPRGEQAGAVQVSLWSYQWVLC